MADPVPLISLEENATAPILRYDIPEPTSYSGYNLMELAFDIQGPVFKQALIDEAKSETVAELKSQSVETIQKRLTGYFANGIGGRELGLAVGPGASITSPDDRPNPLPLPDDPDKPPHRFGDLQLDDIAQKVKDGERIVVTDNPNGDTNVNTIPEPEVIEPRLYLVETIRMTTFLGDYGAGRVVKTFSLLPGESTKISVKTYRQTESSTKKSSSILDSVTKESADDMQNALQSEQSDQKGYEKSKEYYADVSAKASWGWGSAKAKAGVKGSSNATRQESVKSITSATEKHTSKASAKREVQVNSTYEVTQKDGEETALEREIENINVSRTLNFVFRQMNQAFVTFVHLTDVRIGFFNGRRESRREVPISGLDSLLEETIRQGKIDDVRAAILEQLRGIRNFEGSSIDVVKDIEISANDKYRLFDNELTHTYDHPKSGAKYEIPGVVLAVNDYVMRTEGVIVESILGEGVALDQYATRLQDAEVSRRNATVRREEAMADREALINKLAENGDEAKAKVLSDLICPCGEQPKEEGTP
jgi:hypothetical protein